MNHIPGHSTISRLLKLCAEAGLVKVGRVFLDGTKTRANASVAANRTLKHLKKEISKMLMQATQSGRKKGGKLRKKRLRTKQEKKKRRRGVGGAKSEWSLICASHNLLTLWRSGKSCWN